MALIDLLLGKKDPGAPPDPIANDVRRVQRRGLKLQDQSMDEYGKEFETPKSAYDQQAQLEVNSEIKPLFADRTNLRRRLQSIIAQKGMGDSSQGLTEELSQEQSANAQIGGIQSSLPGRIRDLRFERPSRAIALGSQVMGSQNAPIDFYGRKPSRQGGLLPVVTAGIGGLLGGPAGATVGLGAGQAMQGYNNSRY